MSVPAVLLVPGWILVGLVIGIAVRWGSVKLARLEGLQPSSSRWLVFGPPLLTAFLFGIFAWRIGADGVLLIRSLWVAVLVQVIFFDFEHRLILDRVLLPAMVVALVLSLVTPNLGWKASLAGALVAGVLFLLVAVVGAAVFRAEALGFGDVKLSVFIGLILGLLAMFQALFYGVILAGLFSILLIALRQKSMKDSIAYGPYLAAGTLIVLLNLAPR